MVLHSSTQARVLLLAIVLAVNFAVSGLLAYGLRQERRQVEAEVAKSVENLSALLDEAVTGAVGRVDLSLHEIADELGRRVRLDRPLDAAAVNALLEDRRNWLDVPLEFRVVDASGLARFGAGASPEETVSYTDRWFFIKHRDHRDSGLIVTDPIFGRLSKAWIVSFSRRIETPDGRFAGMVTAAVPIGYFTKLLSKLDVGPHGIALLRDSDTGLVTRAPYSDTPNAQLGAKGYSKELADIMASGVVSKTFHPLVTADGVERINSYHRLSKVPYHLVVGKGADDYLTQWNIDVFNAIVVDVVFFGASVLAGWLLWRAFTLIETARERNRLLLRHASDGIHILSADGTIIEASDSICRMLGYERDELIGMNISAVDANFTADQIRSDFEELFAQRATKIIETMHRKKGGACVEVEVACQALEVLGQTVMFCSSRDITARKLAESNLVKANEDLEQFAYVSSHDLQTPLRNIASYAQLLERRYKGRLDNDADEFIGFIVDNTKKMTQLITDLLEYSRVSGRSKVLGAVAAGDALAQARINLKAVVEESGAEIVAEHLPVVLAEESLLVSLFQNLLHNAVKYRAPKRRLRLVISARRAVGEEWIFSVADNGIGIESQYQDKIFEIFQRLDPRTYPEGTGIGLSLCRRIVQRFNGRIWLESSPGAGSTFLFTLRDGSGASSS